MDRASKTTSDCKFLKNPNVRLFMGFQTSDFVHFWKAQKTRKLRLTEAFFIGLNGRRDHTGVARTNINVVISLHPLKMEEKGKMKPIFNARYHKVKPFYRAYLCLNQLIMISIFILLIYSSVPTPTSWKWCFPTKYTGISTRKFFNLDVCKHEN